jgi:hypothetical protein
MVECILGKEVLPTTILGILPIVYVVAIIMQLAISVGIWTNFFSNLIAID